jgi:hypothetical protein
LFLLLISGSVALSFWAVRHTLLRTERKLGVRLREKQRVRGREGERR